MYCLLNKEIDWKLVKKKAYMLNRLWYDFIIWHKTAILHDLLRLGIDELQLKYNNDMWFHGEINNFYSRYCD
jgi:hypothetical protein